MAVNRLFDPGPAVTEPTGRTLSCISCGLYRDVLSPKMKPWGKFRRQLMTIGEGPGEQEDKRGKPWQGRMGTVLSDMLHDLDVDLERDCLSTNSVLCRPPNNRTPTGHEQACCRTKFLYPEIEVSKPKVILLLGGVPCGSVLGSLMPEIDERITKWRGWRVPVQRWNAWACPTFHPSFVSREQKPEVDTIWRQDIAAAIDLLDVPVPQLPSLRERVTILRDEDAILAAIAEAHRARYLSFDYETEGLRAFVHKLVCTSFATSGDRAYAFMHGYSERVAKAWHDLLSDPKVGKISHNLKFEANWSYYHFGVEDIAWSWDSMLAAHVWDNRVGLCGLKLQAFLNFGLEPYDTLISPFLESVSRSDPNSPNRIREFIERHGADEALIYCGCDSLLAFRLAMKQMQEIGGRDGR